MDNTIFYRYLIEALRFKVLHPENTNRPDFRMPGMPYNLKYSGVNGIYWYTRRVFPSIYRAGYANTPEGDLAFAKNFINQLDIRHDPALEKYLNLEKPPALDPQLKQRIDQNPTPAVEPAIEQPKPETTPISAQIEASSEIKLPSQPPTPPAPSATHVEEKAQPTTPLTNQYPQIQIPEGVKRAGAGVFSDAKVFFMRNFGKYFTASNAARLVSAGVGAVVGGGLTQSATGAAIGAGGGFFVPDIIQHGGGRTLLDAGEGLLNRQPPQNSNPASGFSPITNLVNPLSGWRKYAFVIAGVFFLLFITMLSSFGGLGLQTGEASPIVGGDISSCQFTRGSENPQAVPFKSTTLLRYFTEASQKSGIPAAVLAGIARVESPGSVSLTDDSLKTLGCPTSSTGVKGLMQIQPPGTTGHTAEGLKLAAQYLGIPQDQVNYCDIRQSVFLAAGVISSKLPGQKWDPQQSTNKDYIGNVAKSYYGCMLYPSCTNGPFSYGDDLYKSVSSCQPSPNGPVLADASCPVPNGQVTCGSYGKPEPWGGFYGTCRPDSSGNGGHCNNNYQAEVGICNPRESGGNLIRTAKSIDITARGGNSPGDLVYLPTINGKSLTWYYKGVVYAGDGFGWMRLFQSDQTPDGVWSIHFVHANQNIPALATNQAVKSGEVGATMYDLGKGTHIHVTVGLNVGDSPNDLKDFSPNWKFADRDLGMCTK